jgi:hypothetical protein
MNRPSCGAEHEKIELSGGRRFSWCRRSIWGMPHSRFAVPSAFLLAIAMGISLFYLASCRSRSAGGPSLGEGAEVDSTAAGVAAAAYLIPDREEIQKRFGICLPDSGIVPLEVTLRNDTERTLVIHTSHGLAAPEPLHGLALDAGEAEYIPIEPVDVLAVLLGKEGKIGYRRPGIFDAVIGVAVPPALFYYGHRELTVGRRYRSIFKHSIFEATKGGATRPLHIEAGEEIKGYLFFYLQPELNPYILEEETAGVDSARAAALGLTIRPCAERSFDTLSGVEGLNDAAAAYPVGGGDAAARLAEGENHAANWRDGILFALPTGGKWRGGGLLVGRVEEILLRGASVMSEVSGKISSSARMAGAAAAGTHAACAVNFKATSSVYIVDISGPPEVLGQIDLDRKTRRIILTEEGLLVATNDGRCRYLSMDGLDERRDIKLGRHLRDLFLDGDRLYVMEKEELSIYTAVPSDPLRLIESRPIPEADRRFVGIRDDMLYILHGAGNAGWDTLVVYHQGSFEELARTVLPAEVRFADASGGELLLQLDGGLLLRIRFDGAPREFEAEVIGHLPFEAALIERTADGYTVLGRDGSLAADDIVPPLLPEYVSTVPAAQKPPEVTPRRSRAGR